MTEKNARPSRVEYGTGQSHPDQQPPPGRHRAGGTTLERPGSVQTPHAPAAQPSQIPGPHGLPQRTPGALTASRAPQGPPHRDPRFFQPARPAPRPASQPTQQRPMPAPAQLPPRAYQPIPYAAPQAGSYPARSLAYPNPAMPPYAAAQVPRHRSLVNHRPAPTARTFNKKAVLLPLAAMAIASAAIGAFAQGDLGTGTGLAAQPEQVKAHAGDFDAITPIEYVGNQGIGGGAPGVAPETEVPVADASPAVERAGGRHSNGNYDAPSSAQTFGGAHVLSTPVSSSDGGDDGTSATPSPAPAPDSATGSEPTSEPTPRPDPEPAPESKSTQPTGEDDVISSTLDTATNAVGTLTGIHLDLTQ